MSCLPNFALNGEKGRYTGQAFSDITNFVKIVISGTVFCQSKADYVVSPPTYPHPFFSFSPFYTLPPISSPVSFTY